jgi:hypothetical protein
VSRAAGRDRMRAALFAWTGLGLAAFALLPWYLAADKGLLESIRRCSPPTIRRAAARRREPASAVALVALLGLGLCAAGAFAAGRSRGRWSVLGAVVGLVGPAR